MLVSLHVKNLALIEESEVFFGRGLNILTGETGAGKSILIGSVNLALGEKVPKDIVRRADRDALVELLFHVEESTARKLEEIGIFPEDGDVLMARRIARGRSVCRINSETVSAARMKEAASLLINIHGQHEHESLLSRKNHLKYLDAFAGEELAAEKESYAAEYRALLECRKAAEESDLDEKQRERELSFLRFEIDEIEQAGLKPGEDEELEALYRKLSNGKKILEAAGSAYELTGNGAENASEDIGRALRELLSVSEYDETAADLSAQLDVIDSLLADFNRSLSSYLTDADFSDELFAETEGRLDEINRLKSKYGPSIDEILRQAEEKKERAKQLEEYESWHADLQRNLRAAEEAVRKRAEKISAARRTVSEGFEKEVTSSLEELNFPDVRFEVRFEKTGSFTADGIDDVRFYISTNPGEEMHPLEEVASGGELSRIMLALKTVLAEKDDVGTLIFDEIDAGISGRTAQKVAEQLHRTAQSHQVICITHLPQIASMADSHFLIEKTSDSGSTVSEIRELDEEESVRELARMLGGAEITETVLANAGEMRRLAKERQD